MKWKRNERGSTLVVAMLLLLVFLGLTVSMTFDARSQATLTAGVKLQQFYKTAALSGLNQARANLDDYWTNPDAILGSDDKASWRFGNLLARSGEVSGDGYGTLLDEQDIDMNAGLLELHYRVWASNNPDDPSFMLEGMDLGDGTTIATSFDLDGKVVLTTEVFSIADSGFTYPLATQTALVGLTGAEIITRYEEGVREGDDSDPGNQGRGSAGRAASIDIEPLKPASP